MTGTGKAKIDIYNLEAGSFSVFEIVYEAGKFGIDDSGEIIIARRDVCDSAIPQFDDPMEEGYVSVSTDADARLVVSYIPTRYIRPWKAAISIRVRDGSLYPGNKVFIKFGDKSGPGYRIQTYPEVEHIFRVMADCAGSGNFQDLEETPVITITGGKAARIEGCMPSAAKPGIPFSGLVRALDKWGNIAQSHNDSVELEAGGKIYKGNIENGLCELTDIILKKEGRYHPKIKASLISTCNPVICSESHSNIFWGDMHGQTKETVGTGNPDLYFTFARDMAYMDFSAWQGNDFQITDETWKNINKKVKEYNEPGKFVCFLGYEWSGTTPMGGDHNIYFLGDDEKIHRSYHWQIGMDDQDGTARNPLSSLWDEFRGRKDVMAIPHVGGRYGNFDYYDPEFISVVEIHSHHGSFEWFFRDALKRGLRPGVIAASDDHSCRPGLSYPTEVSSRGGFVSFDVKGGYTAVFAEELTRKSIWDAIRQRHCYATSGERMIAQVSCGDRIMGDEFSMDSPPVFDIEITGTSGIRDLFVFRDQDTVFRLNDARPMDTDKIYIEWSGVRVRSRAKKYLWNGKVTIENGTIKKVDEYVNQKRSKRTDLVSDNSINFHSQTSGDTDGFEMSVEGNNNTKITVETDKTSFSFRPDDLSDGYLRHDCGGVNLEIRAGHPPLDIRKSVSLQFIDANIPKGTCAYWVKAVQDDGHALWTSPMYIEFNG